MNLIEQDAADALHSYEVRRRDAFKASERERWARAQPPKIVGTWAPKMTEQQKIAHQQHVIAENLPF